MLKRFVSPLCVLFLLPFATHCSPRTFNNEETKGSKKDKTESSKGSVQIERFEAALQVIEQAMNSGSTPDDVTNTLAKNDTRTYVFRVESLLRLYKDAFKKDLADNLNDFKKLEDILGYYVDTTKTIVNAQKVKAGQKVADYLVQKELTDRAALQKFLKDEKWADSKSGPIGRLRQKIAEVKWDNRDDDNAFMLKQIEQILKDIASTKYDTNDLDNGIHALRKDVRWFILASQSVNGMIVVDPNSCPNPSLASIQLPPDVEKKYNTLKNTTGEPYTCALSKCLYVAALQFSSSVGDAKDIGQAKEFLADALLKSGEVKSASAATAQADTLVKSTLSNLDIYAEAQKLFKDLKKQEVLESIQGELKSCRKGG